MAPSAATNSSVIVAVNNSTATVAAEALVINAAAAVDDDDNNSLSTQALLEENPAADDDSPGELELYVNNDENVAPQNRVNYMLMLAHKQGINVDEIYASIKSRPGKKSIFMWKKEALVAEIKRRNPNARANKKNALFQRCSANSPLSPLLIFRRMWPTSLQRRQRSGQLSSPVSPKKTPKQPLLLLARRRQTGCGMS